ncbi:MAG: hypothetical protein AAFR21_03230 [Pseudomonadota bacterium]
MKNISAVIVGVLVASLTAFAVERMGYAGFGGAEGAPSVGSDVDPSPVQEGGSVPLGMQFIAIIGWFLATLLGSIAALKVASNWAPVAWVIAMTVAGLGLISVLQVPLAWWVGAGALLAPGGGAVAAIRLRNSTYTLPTKHDPLPLS